MLHGGGKAAKMASERLGCLSSGSPNSTFIHLRRETNSCNLSKAIRNAQNTKNMPKKRIWACRIGPSCSHLVETTNVMPLFSTNITIINHFTPFRKHPPPKLLPHSASYFTVYCGIRGRFRVEGTLGVCSATTGSSRVSYKVRPGCSELDPVRS